MTNLQKQNQNSTELSSSTTLLRTGKKPKKSFITPKTAPYIFIAPAVILYCVFTVYPVIWSLFLSFTTRVQGANVFSGLDNYIRLFQDPLFYRSLGNTFIFLIIQVPIMISLALVIAIALNSAMIKMKPLFRVLFFTPAVTSLVAASVIFLLLLNENYGLVNYLLSSLGIDKIAWLSDSFWARISILIVMTWRWTGYNMIIFLAGLQNIPTNLYEAASIDGASKVRQFFAITVPQLKPIFVFTVILSTIGTFQLFDEPFNLTSGGPNNATMTITYYLYQNAFKYFDFGYASAIAYVLVILIAVLSWIQLKLGDDEK